MLPYIANFTIIQMYAQIIPHNYIVVPIISKTLSVHIRAVWTFEILHPPLFNHRLPTSITKFICNYQSVTYRAYHIHIFSSSLINAGQHLIKYYTSAVVPMDASFTAYNLFL
jgi:hypothetical protein